jgi:thymidylate kinase
MARLANWERNTFDHAWQQVSAKIEERTAEFTPFVDAKGKSFSTKNLSLKERITANFTYYMGTLAQLIKPTGFTITLSGVDGAGKSTVLKLLKEKLEHERYPVVVLRHRPGIFPILSAWVKGKEKAEAEAANRMPRQGKNTSVLLSLPRFAYYLLDYMLGYWLVRAKYLSRGYVVLYDRYYFDFMADPRRSNLNLPTWFTGVFYKLVHKPELNIFLYAQPEVILARKQELSYSVIEQLTKKYSKLFTQLATKRSRFVAIENNDLGLTLSSISTAYQAVNR